MKEHLISYLYISFLRASSCPKQKTQSELQLQNSQTLLQATKQGIVEQETSRYLEYVCS